MSQVWSRAADGGHMHSYPLSNYIRQALQPTLRFRQACDAQDASDLGLQNGGTFYWNEYSDTEDEAGVIDEEQVMPTTKIQVTQNSLTVQNRGIAINYSGMLDNLSYHPVRDVIRRALANNAARSFEVACYEQFNATAIKAVASTISAVSFEVSGSMSTTNDTALLNAHIKLIIDEMKERGIPAYLPSSGDYGCLAEVSTLRAFKDELESVYQHTPGGFSHIIHGLVGKNHENTIFVETTHIAGGRAEDSTVTNPTSADPWNNAKSSWAFFFGADTAMEALVVPEEIRGKIPVNYGLDRGIAWYFLGGHGICRPGDTSAAVDAGRNKQATIIKWDSAA